MKAERLKKPRPIRKLLVANRGEIALRVIRAADELGIETVAVYSADDAGALHVEAAGSCRKLEGATLGETYLDPRKLIEAARDSGADAIHPGYGFLSESSAFAALVEEEGITFVGPPAEVLRRAGDKIEAKRLVEAARVPTLPYHAGSPDELRMAAPRLGFPLLVKAAGGGGGRGIRRVEGPGDLEKLCRDASREAAAGFGDGRVYVERLVPSARHIELQVLGDRSGAVVHVGERECSIQRRHQKLIEESPSPALDRTLREAMGDAAIRAARAVGYENAGTVEFLLEVDSGLEPVAFHFLEINARIQVEHPVTEAVSGLDLVAWQLRLASGEHLSPGMAALERRGHAIECRVCAEAPPAFTPSAGVLRVFRPPVGPGIRCDTACVEGDHVSTRYDSLLAKVIAWGSDRPAALRRMELALRSTVILGVETNIDFISSILRHPDFEAGRFSTAFVAEKMAGWSPVPPDEDAIAIARAAARPADAGALLHAGEQGFAGPWELLGGLR